MDAPNNALRGFRLISAAAAASLISQPLLAQDQQAPPRLEDLIPDSAVDDPEDWARQGVSDPAPEDGSPQEARASALEPDSPLDEMPQLTVEWPDDLQLPAVVDLEPEAGPDAADATEFAEFDLPSDTFLPDAEVVRVSDELALAFPENDQLFPLRDEFVDRFAALSTIVELDDDDDNIAQLAARARRDEELLGTMLRVYGYYDAQVIRTVGGIRPGDDIAGEYSGDIASVRFDVLPGVRYRLGVIDLGNLAETPDYTDLRAAFEINLGDPLSSYAIVEEQLDLDLALGETGYPFAEIGKPDLLVDHARGEGDLTLPVQPGGKYVFGEVTSNLPDFLPGDHLAAVARFDPGDVYKRSLELDLRRAVTATGLVSSVTVTPREVTPPGLGPNAGEPGVVAMDVKIAKAPLRTVAGAIGFGSEEGVRIQASWEHRNLFPPEGSLRVRGILGTQEQLAGVTFRKNNFDGRDRVLTLDAYASTIDSDAFEARTIALVGTYERQSNLLFQKPFSWSAGFEIIATQERPPAVNGVSQPRETFFVGALPGSVLIDTSDSLLDPKRGFRLGGRLSPEISRNNGVQSFYLRSQVDASYYQLVGERTVIAGRVRVASIPGTALRNIAPSRRLYAGGGGSVRGYGYQQIGPRDAVGDPSGGRSLVEVSLEARIGTGLMDGAVSVVPFVDAGSVSASATPGFDDIRIGAGVGVRYATGFGPIRVDVGVPLNPGPNDSPVAVYVSLGQAF